MKLARLFLLVCMLVFPTVETFSDQITFSFLASPGNSVDLTASAAGLNLGPAVNLLVSDNTTGQSFKLTGAVTGSTGSAQSFLVLTNPNLVVATFNAGGSNSVLIQQGGGTLLSGVMDSGSTLLVSYPNGTGAFLSTFEVTRVSSAVLGLFGLGSFSPDGAIAVTFGDANPNADHTELFGIFGGGSITIEAAKAAAPESGSLTLSSIGLLILLSGHRSRRRRAVATKKSPPFRAGLVNGSLELVHALCSLPTI